MRLLTIIALLISLSCTAQRDTIIVDSIASKSTNKKANKICNKLDIPTNSEANTKLLTFILDWRGTPYCYGGSTKKCTDCSGFTGNAYREIYKKDIPRVSRDIYANSMPIRKHALYEGDFVFFATSGGDRITHVGIYLWDGFFAHASSSKGVTISNLRQGYYQKTFVGGGAWID
ncbi:MAG: glycoside hydrolase [Bacteroidetes bacterium]|nr:MAG: glycoside hydrolase [Bacteroidota bacterium]